MRVLIATDSFLPHLGGVQSVATLLAKGLRAQGDAVEVLAPWTSGLSFDEEMDGLPVHRLRLGRPGLRLREMAGFARRFPAALRRVGDLLRRMGPDAIVSVFVNSGLSAPLLALSRGRRWAWVATAHGQDVVEMTRKTYSGRLLSRGVLRRADAVAACSEHLLRSARALAHAPLPLARAIPNMVDLAEFDGPPPDPPHPRPYVLAVASLHRKKGLDLLLRALAARPESPDLVVLGEGPERARLLDLAGRLGLAGRVFFRGAVGRPEVVAHLRHAALFALPSRVEPFGIVLAEAMAARCPVVAFAVGGVPEVVRDGAEGLLVPAGDAGGLGAAIASLLGAPGRRREFGEAGRRRVETAFAIPVVTRAWRDLIAVAVRVGETTIR